MVRIEVHCPLPSLHISNFQWVFCSLVYSLILDGIKEFLSSKEITSELLHLTQSREIQGSPALPTAVTSTFQLWNALLTSGFVLI